MKAKLFRLAAISAGCAIGVILVALAGAYWYANFEEKGNAADAAEAAPAHPGLNTFGDSITCGVGVTTEVQSYVTLMAPSFGGTLTNYCKRGDQAVDMTVNKVYPNIARTSSTPAATILIGTNDANLAGIGTNIETIYNRSLSASIAWLAIPRANKVFGQDAACVHTSGDWSADNAVVSGVGEQSTTHGSVLTCTASTNSTGVMYVAYRAFNKNGGTLSVTIDGKTPANDSTLAAYGPGGQAITTQNGATHSIFLARYTGLAAGNHTFVFTVTSATGAGNVNSIMWIGSPYTVTESDTYVYVGGVLAQRNDAHSAETAEYNADASSDAMILAGDGLPVIFVAIRNWVNTGIDMGADSPLPWPAEPIPCLTSPDLGLHPSNCGMAHLAGAFLNALNACKPPRTHQRLRSYWSRLSGVLRRIGGRPANP